MKVASPSKPKTTADYLALVTQIALVIALSIVACRVTIQELVRDTSPIEIADNLPSHNPLATTTLILNLICWLPTILVLIRRAIDPQYTLRLHWSLIPMALLSIWILISCNWASDKFSAVITATTWCSAMSLGWAMSQLVRSWGRFRIVASVLVGLLLIFIAQAGIYRFLELPLMQEEWAKIKSQQTTAANESDQFTQHQFDQSVKNGALLGFFRSPNTFAAVLAIGIAVTAAYGMQRFKDRDETGFCAGLFFPAVLALSALYLTFSRTAEAGLVLCIIAFAVCYFLKDKLAQHHRAYFWITCAILFAITWIIIGIGIKKSGLIHDSLTFRWNYWAGSWSLSKTHPFRGVGWANFGSNYLAHRLPRAAEEIKDPHNIIVKLLTETGLIGASLLIAWLGRTMYELTRPAFPKGSTAPSSAIKLPLAIAAGYIILHFIAEPPVPFEAYWFDAIKVILFGVLLVFGMILATAKDSKSMQSDDRPANLLLIGSIIAIGEFWLHAMVDFAFTETGPLLVMMCLIGAIQGIRHPGSAGQKPRTPYAYASLGIVVLAMIFYVAMIVVPVAMAESKAAAASDLASKKQYIQASGMFREAYATAPMRNSDYINKSADMLMQGNGDKQQVTGLLSEAIIADPANESTWLKRARFGVITRDAPESVLFDYQQTLARNPASLTARREYADYLAGIGKPDDAAKEYQTLLDYNEKLDATEPRRLKKETIEQIKQLIATLSIPAK